MKNKWFFLTALISIFCLGNLYGQQINIPVIEAMPKLPNPYQMRDWKKVALQYDSLAFDPNKTGQYFPLFSTQNSTINYPENPSFGLPTYVGTNSPTSFEAINILPSVISGTLVGLDKSNQNGLNYVQMTKEFFNKRKSENVYLNTPLATSGDDWWYDTMPNIFFYQLYSFYSSTSDYEQQFISVADRWLEAIAKMGGSASPWKIPSMNYRAFSLSQMKGNSSGVVEPEAAGAIGWILYQAYNQTKNSKYRIGAEWSIENLNSLSSNPSYELQLAYGTYTAARMNAELHTNYDIQKMMNWNFNVGSLRSWGAIKGTWGGYDVSGLIGEVNGNNDYAFSMNTFEQIGALVPLVRYDNRFARAMGKWVLNAANAARLFYSKYLPDQNQDGETWSKVNDPNSAIAYEAIRQNAFSNSPFATGDAVSGGWSKTNFSLYSSSHIGILGGIIDTTNISKIIKLDLLKTDYFHSEAYPTYLIYNPYSEMKGILIQTGNLPVDIYDAVSNQFIKQSVSGEVEILIPEDNAMILTLVPTSALLTEKQDHLLANGVVIDFSSGLFSGNYPPRIKALSSVKNYVLNTDSALVYLTSYDPESQPISVEWKTSGGFLKDITNLSAKWISPGVKGDYTISVKITDSGNETDSAAFAIKVIESKEIAPLINWIQSDSIKINIGSSVKVAVSAGTLEPPLKYFWTSSSGSFSSQDSSVTWTAPSEPGNYYLKSTVENNAGQTASDSVLVLVRNYSAVPTGNQVAWYSFSGNATDLTSNGFHGTVFGVQQATGHLGNSNTAYSFNGVDQYIKVTNQTGLNFNQEITTSFWIKVGQFYPREAYPVSHGNWNDRWKISITNKKLRWTVKTSSKVQDLDSKEELSLNQWYHVICLYSGSDLEIYIDGKLSSFSPLTGSIGTTTYDLVFGRSLPADKNYSFNGSLEDFRIFDYELSENEIRQLKTGTFTGVENQENSPEKPTINNLLPSYPNPFNNQTVIIYQIAKNADVSISIYDLLGRKVNEFIFRNQTAGEYNVNWNGTDESGKSVSSGIYLVSLQAGNFRDVQKVILLK